ncbi:MAG: RNA-guided endonuclease IscB, partial [Myxococcota bacterium]
MQNRVFVLGTNKQPLIPCHPSRARQLLKKGRAAVLRRFPFTIILLDRDQGDLQPLRLKFDPGAESTGATLVGDFKRGKRCVYAMELTHRGKQIKESLRKRRGVRKSRRSRKTRYRKPRFKNRRRPKGWLAPSLQSRVDNISAWTARLRRVSPITHLSMELARFDTQAMQNPEIRGVEYQQGALFGYDVREYLLEKWGRTCAYCGVQGVPLQIEHMIPKSRGGSNRVSNLTLACAACNQEKGTKTAKEFGFADLEAKGKKPL